MFYAINDNLKFLMQLIKKSIFIVTWPIFQILIFFSYKLNFLRIFLEFEFLNTFQFSRNLIPKFTSLSTPHLIISIIKFSLRFIIFLLLSFMHLQKFHALINSYILLRNQLSHITPQLFCHFLLKFTKLRLADRLHMITRSTTILFIILFVMALELSFSL